MQPRQAAPPGDSTKRSSGGSQIAIAPTPIAVRLAPALVALGLRRVVTWNEAAFVLDAVEHFDAVATRHWRIAYALLGGKEAGR